MALLKITGILLLSIIGIAIGFVLGIAAITMVIRDWFWGGGR